MFMRDPTITTGFIIFREGIEEQLTSGGKGHWRTARDWVRNSRFKDEYFKIVNDNSNNIHDYDDFLTDYVGAIRTYYLNGTLYCYIPRGNNNEYKSYLKNFFTSPNVVINGKSLSYNTYGDVTIETEIFRPKRIPVYNQTIIAGINGNYMYNPSRIGD